MEPARAELQEAIEETVFKTPRCPIYQNVNAEPSEDITRIRMNLINQLTGPVRWTQSVQRMTSDGADLYIECGPGKVLQGLVKKIVPDAAVASA
jgi:[acyl-carrier-protein] S-malonyltransferase